MILNNILTCFKSVWMTKVWMRKNKGGGEGWRWQKIGRDGAMGIIRNRNIIDRNENGAKNVIGICSGAKEQFVIVYRWLCKSRYGETILAHVYCKWILYVKRGIFDRRNLFILYLPTFMFNLALPLTFQTWNRATRTQPVHHHPVTVPIMDPMSVLLRSWRFETILIW